MVDHGAVFVQNTLSTVYIFPKALMTKNLLVYRYIQDPRVLFKGVHVRPNEP